MFVVLLVAAGLTELDRFRQATCKGRQKLQAAHAKFHQSVFQRSDSGSRKENASKQ
jgi:hypothetical protein